MLNLGTCCSWKWQPLIIFSCIVNHSQSPSSSEKNLLSETVSFAFHCFIPFFSQSSTVLGWPQNLCCQPLSCVQQWNSDNTNQNPRIHCRGGGGNKEISVRRPVSKAYSWIYLSWNCKEVICCWCPRGEIQGDLNHKWSCILLHFE